MPSLVDVAVAVVAAPDRLAGEAVAAFVILAADVAASEADVRRYVRERMPTLPHRLSSASSSNSLATAPGRPTSWT